MICRKCGKEVSDNAKFCKFCGVQFVKKEVVNGRVISKEVVEEKKLKNRNARLSCACAGVAIIGCMLPLSTFGIFAVLFAIIAAIVSLFFRVKGKDEMYQIYDNHGVLVGKQMLSASFTISIICILLALFTVIRFI